MQYENLHRHSHWSNVRISDSAIRQEDYAKRAVELGQKILSSIEHGWCGNVYDTIKLAKKYGLKPVLGAEAYWVKDRTINDRTNAHIVLLAKNENGRQALNDVLSEANLTGFYYQPRLDLNLLLSLPKDDIIVTTACIAYHESYDDIDEITEKLAKHFSHFYLECQYHNTDSQRKVNQHILELRDKLSIPLIFGADSHYIYPEQAQIRTSFLSSKGLHYENEDCWYMDYPDVETVYKRFAEQCTLSHMDIIEAINNTNVVADLIEEYDSPIFNSDIKMPSHPMCRDWTQEQKDEEYKRLVYEAWEEYKKSIPEEKWAQYEQEIVNEVQTVVDTKMADYFILNPHIIKRGKEFGGKLTLSSRGSAGSFCTNMLLGLVGIDRIRSPVHMYADRFLSTTRVLETKSLPDIDFNCANVAPFAKAQEEILGDLHAKPMVAFGTFQKSSAWKLYAKSQGLEFGVANAVSEQIRKYESAVKRANEDDRDSIDIKDYIDKEFWDIYDKSEDYQGLITSWSIAPCAYILYNGNIRKEFGLSKIKDAIVANIDGKWAEEGCFLKNDLLTVKSVDIIYRTYNRIGKQPPSVQQLIDICPPEDECWQIYKSGATLFINQCEQDGTRQRVQKYAPTNISELAAFIAAIRPGFKSQYKIFENREPFSFGVKAFDDLIKTKEFPHSYILYQEQAMRTLAFAGIPMNECYTVVKNIAKKRADKVYAFKEKFLDGFTKAIIDEGKSEIDAKDIAIQLWQVIEDSAFYSFNASHAFSMAADSLYGAWLKAHYPLEFYETCLTICEEKGDKDRMNALKDEAESYFQIKFPPYRFGQDNRTIKADLETNSITNSLSAIKGFSSTVGNALYDCTQLKSHSFIDILKYLYQHGIKESKLRPLIQIDYFEQFGNANILSNLLDVWELLKSGEAKQIKKENVADNELLDAILQKQCTDKNKNGSESISYKLDNQAMEVLYEYEKELNNAQPSDFPIKTKMKQNLDILGYVDIITNKEEDRRWLLITDVTPMVDKSGNLWSYRIGTRSIGTGKTARLTVKTEIFKKKPITKGDIIYADDLYKNNSGYWYLTKYTKEAC